MCKICNDNQRDGVVGILIAIRELNDKCHVICIKI